MARLTSCSTRRRLLVRHLLEVRKVEAQVFGRHERTFLLDVRTEHLAQRFMHQMGRRMVVGSRLTFLRIHDGHEGRLGIFGQLGNDMDNQAVLLLGSHDRDPFVGGFDIADIADLTAGIAVERSAVEHQLVGNASFGGHTAVAGDLHLGAQRVVTDELALLDMDQAPSSRRYRPQQRCANAPSAPAASSRRPPDPPRSPVRGRSGSVRSIGNP